MASHGKFTLDEAQRRSWYSPEVALADLKEGDIFVDVGCGDGYFSILAAKKVGATGKVYSVDVDSSGVEKLQSKAKAEGLINITSRAGKAEETVFCHGCADMVFFSMDLHDFSDPKKVLENAFVMIKPSGKVVDLDWKKQSTPFGPPERIRFSEQYVTELLDATGFVVESIGEAGPYHYVIKARPR
ncbi:MAG: class I SAM-dependent methyltransferase [Candidatus Bathyarchaeota archaeon]|nr:class I SAM-dependent methyltransferase [Candidatus Bathyarchaeota archaeon]